MGLPAAAPITATLLAPLAFAGRPAAPLAALDADDRALLCRIRRAARSAQIGAVRDAAAALLAALDAGASRRLVFHPGPASSVSFGEAWLLSLVKAMTRRDRESAAFLVARCVAKPHRRVIFQAAERLAAAVGSSEAC